MASRNGQAGLVERMQDMRADYSAAKSSRFRRRRNVPALGAGGDYHYRSEAEFLRIMEYARDMERNDSIAGPLVERAVTNIVQNGLMPDPKTGDAGLDQAIKDRWWEWAGVGSETSGKAFACSVDGELSYRDLEKMALRRMLVDGDCFAVLTDLGAVELVEAHRCRTPQRTQKNVVHGILLDERRRRKEYWFTKDDIDLNAPVKVGNISPRPAFDEHGRRTVLYLGNPKRPTQARCVSAFAPVFDLLGMHEDLNFAKLVQQQVASCIAFIRQLAAGSTAGGIDPYGAQTTQITDTATRIIQELAPGLEIRGRAGETITVFSPNIPNSELFQQMRQILQLIGINLGLPLVALLMDASDTNFSGWRGAMDQARMGFRDVQQHLIDHFESPVYVWAVRNFARQDAAIRAALPAALGGSAKSAGAGGRKLFEHEWKAPRWPYVQPLQDAQADQTRQKALLASPRKIHSDLSQDWEEVISDTVADNASAIEKAAEKAAELGKKGIQVSWREILFLTDVEMQKLTLPVNRGTAPAAAQPKGTVNDERGTGNDEGGEAKDDEDKEPGDGG